MNKKIAEICIPFLLLIMLGRAFASDGQELPPIVNIDLTGVIESINGMFSGLNQSLSQLPNAVVSQFFSVFQGLTASFLTSLLSITKLFVVTNPDISPMFPLWQTIVYIISLFYLLIFLTVGLLFIFSSIDAEKRATAKQWFKSTIIMIAAVGSSYYFYSLFLQLGAAIANYLWTSQFETLFQPGNLTTLNILLLIFYSTAVLAAFITFFIRHLFLLIGTAIFPIALALYFIPPTKAWGKMLLEILFAAVFMQIIDAIIFIGTQAVWNQFTGIPDIAGWAPAMAFSLVAITNTAIIFFAITKAGRTISNEMPEVVAIIKTVSTAAIGALA